MPVVFDAAGNVSGAQFPRGWGLNDGSTANSSRLSEDPRTPPHRLAGEICFMRATSLRRDRFSSP
jgi:hypothetical protein